MTGEERFKEQALTLGAFYLEHHLPTEQRRLSLDDHGCEVIGGLSEVYFLAAHKAPEKKKQWQPAMHRMLDRVLETGPDKNGFFYMDIDPVRGKVRNEELTDNWGYNYNAFAVVAALDDIARYRKAIETALQNLPEVKGYPWEGDSADGIADSLEGGINLMNRFPTAKAHTWADGMAQRLLAKQRDTGVIEGWHGDGNAARTALMYALWKSKGCYVTPWRADLDVGAVREDGRLHVTIASDWPWKGNLHFDVPRHTLYFNLPTDYARLNQFPEWFTVKPEQRYRVEGLSKKAHTCAGEALAEGIEVQVTPDDPARLTVTPE